MSATTETRERIERAESKVLDGERLSADEALALLEYGEVTTLGALADLVRRRDRREIVDHQESRARDTIASIPMSQV